MSWGLCKDCKWWQIEPDAKVDDRTMGMCIEEELFPFRVSIPGDGGCNRFIAGDVAREAGSGVQPPTAGQSR